MKVEQIKAGACYSNGDFGRKWCVWQVVDITATDDAGGQVRFKILVGENRRKYRTVLIEEFASQARYEVVLIENSWQRAE